MTEYRGFEVGDDEATEGKRDGVDALLDELTTHDIPITGEIAAALAPPEPEDCEDCKNEDNSHCFKCKWHGTCHHEAMMQPAPAS